MKPRRIILFRFFVLLFVIPAADAAAADAARQPWDETVKAAEKESAVSAYFWPWRSCSRYYNPRRSAAKFC
jgi:hypothetical protein